MGSGRRITVALVGLVLLALIGWLATDLTGSHRARPADHRGPAAVSVSPEAPRPAGASG
ncbi:MAG TPA: hypothetical protein VJX10_11705 [Pseudonocardiaceae bacterium]|nr:hypothetical protein [Pseudonocardiaceae bacterium]